MKREKRSAQERIRAWALGQTRPFDTAACARGARANVKTVRNRLCEMVRDNTMRRVDGGGTVCYAPVPLHQRTKSSNWAPNLDVAESILRSIRERPKSRNRFISLHLGLSRETVSRYMTALAAEGYIVLDVIARATGKPGPVKLNNLLSYKRGQA
ncbi:MAG: winged helix-turn-helix transcriptional regulator [Candidatus Cloacimonetes bacterium]|nr:winged helix-turn-helix transcriptional regulator [Candidatus Cloacimonadota bacterium]